MLRRLFSVCLLLSIVTTYSQKGYTRRILLPSTLKYTPGNWNLRDSIIRDTSVCRILYKLRFVVDTSLRRDVSTVMVCDIGEKYQSYFSLAMKFSNTVFTKVQAEADSKGKFVGISVQYPYTEKERELEEFAGDAGSINSEIWLDFVNRTLTERAADYANDNLAYEYEEPMPILDWDVSTEEQQLCGYVCLKATCRFRGRNWTVWFTPEIPFPSGPWKLYGLPGLILKAEDSQNHYVWECCGIEQISRPMSFYVIPTRKRTRKQFNTWMTRFHQHPYETIDGGRRTTLIQTFSAEGLKEVDDSWTIPYNPIELE